MSLVLVPRFHDLLLVPSLCLLGHLSRSFTVTAGPCSPSCYSLTALHFASESHARCFCFSRSAYHPFFSLNADRSLPSVSGLPSWLSLSCMSFLPLLGHFLSFVLRCVPQCLFVPCDFPFHCSSLFSRLFSALSLYSSLGCSASS